MGEHQHDESCYESRLTCDAAAAPQADGSGMEPVHVHGAECCEKVLICQQFEHVHDLSCRSNPEADVEDEQTWEKSMSNVTLSGSWSDDVIAVAESQIGYHESEKNYQVEEDGVTAKGYTRYGEWYGAPYEDWSAMFVSFCLHYAKVPQTAVPYESDSSLYMEKLTQMELFRDADYTPKKGDLAFFDTDADDLADRVGLVTELVSDDEGKAAQLKTIEGDAENHVQTVTHDLTKRGLLGFAALPENSEAPDKLSGEANDIATGDAPVLKPQPEEQTPPVANVQSSATASGTCGTNVTWSLTDDGVLTISGSGTMENYAYSTKAPWYSNKDTITKVVIENGVTSIGDYAFKDCNNLVDVTISEGVTYVGDYAFSYCHNLAGVELPSSLTEIRGGAFNSCSSLTSVTIPEGVRSIGSYMFSDCSELISVTIPASVTSIAGTAFNGCTSLKRIDVAADNTKYSSDSSGVLLNKDQTQIVHVPAAISGTYTIPAGVKSFSFSGCNRLSSVVIPEGVTTIPYAAFSGCTHLTSVTIPESVTRIESSAFKDCSHLTSLTIPKNVTTIGADAFSGCNALDTVNWDATDVTSFGAQKQNPVASFEVVFGQTMNKLSKNTFDQLLNMGATAARFEADPAEGSYITIEAGVAADFLPPSISGRPEDRDYYVSPVGVYYRILTDESGNKTARLAYYPVSRADSTYTVLAAPIGAKDIPVVGVSPYAFYGSQVEELIFAAPEQINFLGNFAFYNARQLRSINGETTATNVLNSFPYFKDEPGRSERGVLLFENTKIGSPYYPTNQNLVYDVGGFKLTIEPPAAPKEPTDKDGNVIRPKGVSPDDDKKSLYYTGQEAITKINIQTPGATGEDEYIARVCVRFDSTQGGLGRTEGRYVLNDESGNKVCDLDVKKVPDQPNCYRLDFSNIQAGKTASINVVSSYPSGTSRGGTASIWGCILTKEEAEKEYDTKMKPLTSDYHQLRWETKTDEHTIGKTLIGDATVVGDGKDGAIFETLTWNINLIRGEGSLEGYGRDNIESIDFTDTLTLPEGAELLQELKDAIKNDTYEVRSATGSNKRTTYSFYMPDGSQVITLEVSNGGGASLGLTEDGKLTVTFRVQNNDTTHQIQDVAPTLTLNKGFVHMGTLDANKVYKIKNDISVNIHYMYSEDQTKFAECESEVKTARDSLVLSKDIITAEGAGLLGASMGETVYFKITAQNPGYRPYTKLYHLKDAIPDMYYLSPEQLTALFAADERHQLTVTINNAAICAHQFEEQTVTGMDGKTTGTTSLQNTGNELLYNGKAAKNDHNCDAAPTTITLSWGDGDGTQIQIKVGETEPRICSLDVKTIQDALDSAGFLVTAKTQYTLDWKIDGTPVGGGSQIEKIFAVTAKDTFMNLTEDGAQAYNGNKQQKNTVVAYDVNNNWLADATQLSDMRIEPEFHLSKLWSFNGTDLSKGDAKKQVKLKQGSVLDYSLMVNHEGDGSYDLLPLVDHMTGAQALLVPYELNKNQSWVNEETTIKTVGGVQYYLLNKAGIYPHVWTGEGQMADSVTVKKEAGGWDTLIKWYFTNYAGLHEEEPVTYQSMVLTDVLGDDKLDYELGNETWLNDHPTHRLHHNVIGWSGAVFDIDKAIVSQIGDIPTADSPRDSLVEEGQSIVYCLTLFNTPVGEDGGTAPEVTIKGSEMSDILPLSVDGTRWVKGKNVSLTYSDSCTLGGDTGTEWYVTEADDTNKQSIQWNDEFTLTFQGQAYIYVTLTYPKGDGWDAYTSRYGSEKLVNTFQVLSSEASVTHSLKIPGEVRLQKSVYSSRYSNGDMSSIDALLHYSNDTLDTYVVTYYVVLYNGGRTRLYVEDMQDQLPRGFTLINNNTSIRAYTSKSGDRPADVYNEKGEVVTVRIPSIKATTEPASDKAGETQRVTFHFSKNTTGNNLAIAYDETLGMCYLNPNEAILFVYRCCTHEQADTDTVATNVISMPYRDLSGSGVGLDENISTRRRNQNSDGNKTFVANDGDCKLQTTAEVEQYGFTGGDADTQWLTSEVTVTRGQIKPSLTKKLTGATNADGTARTDLTWVDPNDTVTWTVTAKNEGIYQMQDYVLTDVMEKPYTFTGEVIYETKGYNGKALKLFNIENFGENTVDIKYSRNYSTYDNSKTLTIDGDPFTWSNGSRYDTYYFDVTLAFSRDKNGNAVMSIRLQGKSIAIPAGGSGELKLSTKNTSKTQQTRQFVNGAYITPMAQEWDGNPSNGSKVKWKTAFDTQLRDSVHNTAQVMVSLNAGTSSAKSVTQTDKPGNTAISTADVNYIWLDDMTKTFDYTLSVTNGTGNAIRELVLIDALPQVGDHSVFNQDLPRYSEFKVSLADNPSFTVKVKQRNGTETTLAEGQYTIDYAVKNDFGTDDWNGYGNGVGWVKNQTTATRSIRLTIKDDAGTLIPDGSTLSLKFTCKVDGTAEGADAALPGEVAWNRFGYQYKDSGNTPLQAGPLKVGVKVPEMPKLIKKLVDSQGAPTVAARDENFSFLLYEGETLMGSFETKNALIAALGERNYQEFNLKVEAGKSESDAIFLKPENWSLEEGKTYTLVEISNNSDYVFDSLDGRKTKSITFKFDSVQDKTIVCKNLSLLWEAKVLKQNESAEPLAGAVFALYSPEKVNYAVPSEYASLNVQPTVVRDGKTWYLCGIESTNAEGTARWTGLREECYYLVEVKAPNGYHLPKENARLLSRENAAGGVATETVINYTGHILPGTGGVGTHWYTLAGLLLMVSASSLLLLVRKKRKTL